MTLTLGPDELIVLEAFAGPGGISEALRRVLPKVRAVGIEKDADACDTAEAAGHERIRADVSMVDLRPLVGHVLGFCAGPPCQSFSQAGRQLGRLDRPRIEAHIARIRRAGRWLHYSREGWHDPRSPLVLEVLRYVLTLRPEFVVLEQVPQVLPLWELVAEVLRDHGWTVATGILKAEQYAVPQTRKRAILVASTRVIAELPPPTHRYYRKGIPREAGDSRLKPWVSMADALGRGMTERPSVTVTGGGTGGGGGAEPFGNGGRQRLKAEVEAGNWVLRSNYSDSGLRPGHTADERGRTLRDLDQPATAVTGRPAQWALRQSAQANATVRTGDEPAPTITAGHDSGERQFVRFGNQEHSAVRDVGEPAATVRFSERVNAIDWVDERPSPTVVTTRRSSEGVLIGRQLGGDPKDASQLPAVRVTVQEAAVLQSFRPDYPWRGSKSAQYRQVGDAAPPVLMAAVIREVTK